MPSPFACVCRTLFSRCAFAHVAVLSLMRARAGCAQICVNTQDSGNNTDSAACACYPGYELAPDGYNCTRVPTGLPTGAATGSGATVMLTETLYTDKYVHPVHLFV